jgi:hypothetical protein
VDVAEQRAGRSGRYAKRRFDAFGGSCGQARWVSAIFEGADQQRGFRVPRGYSVALRRSRLQLDENA